MAVDCSVLLLSFFIWNGALGSQLWSSLIMLYGSFRIAHHHQPLTSLHLFVFNAYRYMPDIFNLPIATVPLYPANTTTSSASRTKCAITGKPAKYLDPLTKLPYVSM